MTLYLLCILAIYAMLLFNAVIHNFVKKTLLQIDSDHLTDVVIHSVHVIWVSVFSCFVVIAEYKLRTHNFLTIFPTLFLATFYMHELNVRRMTNDVKLHHVSYIIIFILTLYDKMSVVFAVFNMIEFGHVFHFMPYIMYKCNYRLPLVLAVSNIACVGFFLVRIIAFIIVVIFVAYSNWSLIMNYSLPKMLAVFSLIGTLFALQIWMYMDVYRSRRKIREKCRMLEE